MGNYITIDIDNNIKNDFEEIVSSVSDGFNSVSDGFNNITNSLWNNNYYFLQKETIKNIILKSKLTRDIHKDITNNEKTKLIYYKFMTNTIEVEHAPSTKYIIISKYGNTEFSFIFPEYIKKIYI